MTDYLKLAEECGGVPMLGIVQMNEADLARLIARVRAEAVPAGWKLVPVEPTNEMIDAADFNFRGFRKDFIEIYREMLAAAPALPEEPQ